MKGSSDTSETRRGTAPADEAYLKRVGEQVRVVPNHVCIVTHLNDTVYGVRGTHVETHWEIEARGRGTPPLHSVFA